MSQQALALVGADLEQTGENSVSRLHELYAEAARMAALAGGYGAFGLKLTVDEPEAEAWPQPNAEDAYLAETPEVLEAANESAPAAEIIQTAPDAIEPATIEVVEPSATARTAFPAIAPRSLSVAPLHAVRFMQGVDWILVLAAAQLAALWSNGEGLGALTLTQAVSFLAASGALKAGLWSTSVYRTAPGQLRPEHGAGGLALGVVGGLIIATLFAPDARAAAALSATLPFAALLMAGAHAAFAIWFSAAHKAGAFSETIVLVGATEAAGRLAQRAAERGDARVAAIVDDRLARAPHVIGGVPVSGSLDDLLTWESLPHVDRIVITVTQKAEGRVRAMIEKLRLAPNRVDLLLDYDTVSVRGRRVDRLTGSAMACVSGRPHHAGRALMKRAQDVTLSALLLVAFAPLMAVIALAVRIDSKGPVLYRQRRHGFNNRVITILKFRTMRHDPEAPLRQVEKDDPRVTRIGGFLRRTSLDELPQLLNVLCGEMSLVGPRPHAVGMRAADRDLSHIVAEYAHRHQVKPGITGWAQVNGSRGPIETPASVRERVKLDLHYVSNASLWLDLAILLRTIPALLGDKGTR